MLEAQEQEAGTRWKPPERALHHRSLRNRSYTVIGQTHKGRFWNMSPRGTRRIHRMRAQGGAARASSTSVGASRGGEGAVEGNAQGLCGRSCAGGGGGKSLEASLLDISAPPYINNGRTWFLDSPDKGLPHASRLCGKILQPETHVLVLAAERNPLVAAVLGAIEKAGTVPKLLLPGEAAPQP